MHLVRYFQYYNVKVFIVTLAVLIVLFHLLSGPTDLKFETQFPETVRTYLKYDSDICGELFSVTFMNSIEL